MSVKLPNHQPALQVLLDLKRTASTVQPGHFSFGEHFDFEELIGQSKHSEVCCCQCSHCSGWLLSVQQALTTACLGLACAAKRYQRAVRREEGHAGIRLQGPQGQVCLVPLRHQSLWLSGITLICHSVSGHLHIAAFLVRFTCEQLHASIKTILGLGS